MHTLKKLIFAPLFLIVFTALIYQLSPVFKSYDFIFSLSLDTLVQLIIICLFILLSCLLFILFASLAMDWKLILSVEILTSLTPFLFFDQATAVIATVGIFLVLTVSFLSLENTMKSYLTFNPNSLLGPIIKHLSVMLILVIAVSYFLAINKIIVQKGFELPDSLINPKILNSLDSSVSQALKDQIQSFIKPFLGYIPIILALLLFLTLQSITSLISLFIHPLLWLIFLILEKTGFVKFEEEQRTIKKLFI